MDAEIRIDPRFNGPDGTANGGYACGRFAAGLGTTTTVRLSRPVPLGQPLQRRRDDDGVVRIRNGEDIIAEARDGTLDLTPPEAISLAQARTAEHDAASFGDHPFPRCFVCGPKRDGDGLEIFVGQVAARPLVACTWRPPKAFADDTGRLATPLVWAALDCPGAFASWLGGKETLLLGQLTARIDTPPPVDEPCIVLGWPIAHEGRKRRVGTALVSGGGALYAIAEGIWIGPKLQ